MSSTQPKPVLVPVKFQLLPSQAMALAQMVKRIGFSEWRALSVDTDEAYVMRDACDALRKGLADVGFSPR